MRFFVGNISRWYPASRVVGLIVAILVAMLILGLSARAEVASSILSLPQPTAQSVLAAPVLPTLIQPLNVPTVAAAEVSQETANDQSSNVIPSQAEGSRDDVNEIFRQASAKGGSASGGQDDKKEKLTETPAKLKNEYIEWRRGYVSGVSDRIITVVVSTAQRRGSYEPVEITPTTKITRGGRPAVLKEIRIRQYAGVRGYRQGDIVKATEYSIGGFPYARSAVRKRAVIRRKPIVNKKAPAKKKTPAKPTGKDSKTLHGEKK